MNQQLSYEDYNVEKVITDFSLLGGDQNFSLSTQIRIGLADDKIHGAVEVTPTFKETSSNSVVLSVTCVTHFLLPSDFDNDKIMELLKTDGSKQAYEKTKMVISELLKISNVDFINLPDYNSLNK